MSNVNHPKHYEHPSGVECIDIVRHYCFSVGNAIKYLWRAGIKQEEGMTPVEKEIEDLEKAKWYINDRIIELKSKEIVKSDTETTSLLELFEELDKQYPLVEEEIANFLDGIKDKYHVSAINKCISELADRLNVGSKVGYECGVEDAIIELFDKGYLDKNKLDKETLIEKIKENLETEM